VGVIDDRDYIGLRQPARSAVARRREDPLSVTLPEKRERGRFAELLTAGHHLRQSQKPYGRERMRGVACLIMALMTVISSSAAAQPAEKWVTSWTGSVQGPYPIGNPSAQPDLRFAFPSAESGARDQSFRLIVRPDLWGRQVRLRFSNALGAIAESW